MYYIMPQRIDMRLMMTQMVPRKPRNDTTNTNMNTMLQSSQQRLSSFGVNVFNGNTNGVFAARGRPCG